MSVTTNTNDNKIAIISKLRSQLLLPQLHRSSHEKELRNIMTSSPQSSPKAATTATKLPWTPDDDDAGWDDSYDVDEDLMGSLGEKEDKKEDDPPIILNSDDGNGNDGDGDGDCVGDGDGDGIFPDESTRTTPAFTQIPPEPTTHYSSGTSAINDVNNNNYVNDDNNAAPARNKLSTISSPYTNTPMSQVHTPFSQVGTPLELYDGEDNFEETVRKRNRIRKEREDYHIAHIKVQMSRLEDALAAETKRRVDATTSLDELSRTQVHEMEERVRGQLSQENEKLQYRLGALEERVRTLEQNWTNESKHQTDLVHSKASDLGKSIEQIRDDQDMERKARLKREGMLLQQVEEHSKEFEDRWTSERTDRIQRLEELEDQIIRNEARLALEQKKYEERIEIELTSLKEELAIEADERQAQDEDIVAALNRYTQQLQQSLSILSSD